MIAAVTITYNRLELTKRTFKSFYAKTKADHHVIVDNASTDGTKEFIKSYPHIYLDKNYGILEAFACAVNQLPQYDYILKLDNDIEVLTDNIIDRILDFYKANGNKFICSPVDVMIDPAYEPKSFGTENLNGFNVNYTTHTGGAFQVIPKEAISILLKNLNHCKGDIARGAVWRSNGFKPLYLTDLQIKHIGINQGSNNYKL